MTLVASSCTDVLDQMPTTEDTSKDVYAEAANYKRVLAKIYASYVLAGQGQGGDNGDLTSINKQDFSRGYFNLQEAATDETTCLTLPISVGMRKILGFLTPITGFSST